MNKGRNERIGGNTFSTKLWLFMAESGGWWTAMEIRDHFAKDRVDINRANWTLLAMMDRKEVARMDGTHPKYAVTKSCIVPRGVSCERLMAAMGAG